MFYLLGSLEYFKYFPLVSFVMQTCLTLVPAELYGRRVAAIRNNDNVHERE